MYKNPMSVEKSQILLRREQISRWTDSDSWKASKDIKIADRIKFSKEVQYLSACKFNDWSEVERLLKEGIDINCTQDDGLTALHQACIDDDFPLVRYLFDRGANIDAQDKEGWTPLFAAVSCNYLTIMRYLIVRGARLDMLSIDGELAIDQSTKEGTTTYIREEMNKRNFDPTKIKSAERNAIMRDIENMKRTKNFSQFTMVDGGGSMLHIAAAKDYTEIVEKLIEISDPQMLNHTDDDGWSALHAAAHWGSRKACVLLINADIDFDKVTSRNQTVLDVARDDVKPYIREEVRNAKFRRQEKASVKRAQEHSETEYKPSETKIPCTKGTSSSSSTFDDRPQPQLQDNRDKLVEPEENLAKQSLNRDVQSEHSGSTTSVISGISHGSETFPSDSLSISSIASQEVTQSTTENSRSDSQPVTSPKVIRATVSSGKLTESETQRKEKARLNRSTRRSTQGVTPEDVNQATKAFSTNRSNIVQETSHIVSNYTPKDDEEFKRNIATQEATQSTLEGCRHDIKTIDNQSVTSSKVITTTVSSGKLTESETQRKEKARLNRSTRRSTQGITSEDINQATKAVSTNIVQENPHPASNNIGIEDEEIKPVSIESQNTAPSAHSIESSDTLSSNEPQQNSDTSDSGLSASRRQSLERTENKEKTGNHSLDKLRIRNRPPTGTIDAADIKLAQQKLMNSDDQKSAIETIAVKEKEVDYKMMYENELQENQKLNGYLERVMADLERSNNTMKTLQSNRSFTNDQSADRGDSIYQYDGMEKLQEENKKLKEANNALIRVISRLAHATSKSFVISNQ